MTQNLAKLFNVPIQLKSNVELPKYPYIYGSYARPLGFWIKGSFRIDIDFEIEHKERSSSNCYFSLLHTSKLLTYKEMNKLELVQIDPQILISPKEIESEYQFLKYGKKENLSDIENRRDIRNIMKDLDPSRYDSMDGVSIHVSITNYIKWLEKQFSEEQKNISIISSDYSNLITSIYKKRGYNPSYGIEEYQSSINTLTGIYTSYITEQEKEKVVQIIEWINGYITDMLSNDMSNLNKGIKKFNKYNSRT